MKFLIMILSLGGGVILGVLPRPYARWGRLRSWILVVWIALSALATLLPPIAADIGTLRDLALAGDDQALPVRFRFAETTHSHMPGYATLGIVPIGSDKSSVSELFVSQDSELFAIAQSAPESVIAPLRYDKRYNLFYGGQVYSTDPLFVLPYVPALGERMRIINFHVPVAWIAVLAYLFSMYYSIQYLRHRQFEDDLKAASAAALGTVFCILATVTGMIWARFNWGHFWNWDPRETSIFMLLLIYGAYFTLRATVDREDARARLSAVYNILAAVTVPFFIFVLPRITTGLHPGSASEETAGPILSADAEMLNLFKQFTFAIALGGFTALFLRLQNIMVRLGMLKYKLAEVEDGIRNNNFNQ